MKRKPVEIIRHRTLNSCLAAFHGCKVSELPKRGYWTFHNRQGKRVRLSVGACMRDMRKRGCWGWVLGKRWIHLWVSGRATMPEAISLIAHELGHCEKPNFGHGAREEQKAAKYEDVARRAEELAWRLVREQRYGELEP
jgi:hypothetical protein